jgi:altronate dehydratase
VEDIPAGGTVVAGSHAFAALDPIPLGHKVALADIAVGQGVVKYGEVIGLCQAPIARGNHVHRHNLDHRVDELIFKLREEAR